MSFFDECYQSYTRDFTKPADWNLFWKNEIKKLQSIETETQIIKKVSNKLLTEINYSLKYYSADNFELTGQFVAPRLLTRKPPLLIIFNNYLDQPTISKAIVNSGIAQFVVRLRGHETPIQDIITESQNTKMSYGYFQNRLLDKEQYYLKYLLLDAYRSYEIITSRTEFDKNKIAIWGSGTGALMALFVSYFAKNKPNCLFLSHPDICDVDLISQISKTPAFQEIYSTIKKTYATNKNNIALIKNNLSFFDGMNFVDDLNIPTAVLTNIANKDEAPQGAFSLFHKIKSEKEMHLQTDFNSTDPKSEIKKETETVIKYLKRTFELK